MKKGFFKRLTGLFVTFAVLVGMVGMNIIPDNSSKTKATVVTDEIVIDLALMWASTIEPELELFVNNIIPLVEVDGNKIGYTASYFSQDGTPYGYIILNFSHDGLVDEFVIEEGALGMAEAILDNASVSNYSRAISNDSVVLHRTLPFEYAVSVENTRNVSERAIYGFYGEVTTEEFEAVNEAMAEEMELSLAVEKNQPSLNLISTASANPKVEWWGEVLVEENKLPIYTIIDSSGVLKSRSSYDQAQAIRELVGIPGLGI